LRLGKHTLKNDGKLIQKFSNHRLNRNPIDGQISMDGLVDVLDHPFDHFSVVYTDHPDPPWDYPLIGPGETEHNHPNPDFQLES
jgi:hypothetical protein